MHENLQNDKKKIILKMTKSTPSLFIDPLAATSRVESLRSNANLSMSLLSSGYNTSISIFDLLTWMEPSMQKYTTSLKPL